MDADVYGFEAGIDTQYNVHHKFGIFASYRKGKYDFSGRGVEYQSPIASDIEID